MFLKRNWSASEGSLKNISQSYKRNRSTSSMTANSDESVPDEEEIGQENIHKLMSESKYRFKCDVADTKIRLS